MVDSDALNDEDGDGRWRDVPRISFAQNFEDVRLWKALGHLDDHIWVDVGAAHPVNLSVTRLFHQRGWRGINIEPGPPFELLCRDRPRDVNIAAVVSDREGMVEFNIAWPHTDLSSLDVRLLESDPVNVQSWQVVRRPTLTLASILDRYAGDTPIAFLKVDVEGAELEVLASNDWARFRPLVVLAEAVEPRTHRPSYAAWEPVLLDAGYEFAVDDGLNRFYARSDRPDLRDRLAAPVSVIDGFVPSVALLRGTGDPDQRLVATVIERDRALKEAEALLAPLRRHEAELLAAVGHLRGRADELEAELVALRASWGLRIGRLALRTVRPLLPLARPVGRRLLWLRRLRSARPENLRAVVSALVEPGREFAALAPRPIPDPPSAGELCRAELLRHRRHGPRLLDAAEWETVVYDAGRGGGPVELERLAALPEVSARPVVDGPHNTLVIDARAIDLLPCGTRTHAANLLRVALDAVPDDVRVLSQLPFADPSDDRLARFDGVWDPDDEGAVGAFLQLAPFIHDHDDTQIRLVTSPAIRSAGVFLDAIMGANPHDFLHETERFFQYQFGLECLARFDRVLSLSGASDAEVIASGVAPERIVRTGTLPRPVVTGVDASVDPGLPFERWIVVVGNVLVHKNLPVGVVGAAAAAVNERDGIGVVLLANVDDRRAAVLRDAAVAVGLEPHRLVVRTLVDDPTFDALVRGAEVVVVPSRHEGYSLPVVESLDRGTPVVVSDIAAHRELLGVGRWMFDPDDPEDARRAIAWVLRRGRSRVLQRERQAWAARIDPDRFDRAVRSTVAWLCEGLAGRGSRVEAARSEALAAAADTLAVPPVDVRDRHLSLSKVCELEDFSTPRLREVLREVFPHELVRFGPSFPDGAEWRKYWEVAMAVLTFRDTGLLGDWARILGIGAGNEPTVFHLTQHAQHVLATDLYLAEGWEESADSTMLTDPGRHWPFPWDPTRLEVRHMDALLLDLPDGSFDGVFSSSSIEHFGDRDDVRRSLDEIFRVLRPGGVLSISTEYRIAGGPPGIPGTLLFDADEVTDLFVGGRAWSLVEPFDPSVSAATLATAAPFTTVALDQQAQVARLGGLWTHHIRYDRYPHIVLDHQGRRFTSFHLALRKD